MVEYMGGTVCTCVGVGHDYNNQHKHTHSLSGLVLQHVGECSII